MTQTLTLPYRLPAGITLSSLGTGKIAMVLDPENILNETFKNNNTATSGPVTLRLLGTDGTTLRAQPAAARAALAGLRPAGRGAAIADRPGGRQEALPQGPAAQEIACSTT